MTTKHSVCEYLCCDGEYYLTIRKHTHSVKGIQIVLERYRPEHQRYLLDSSLLLEGFKADTPPGILADYIEENQTNRDHFIKALRTAVFQ